MTNISPRTWVLFGFGISLLSVVINVFVLSSINEKLKDAESELSKLTTSISNQATEMNRAEVIYGQFATLNALARMAPADQRKSASDDSIFLLQQYLDRKYIAVNDIPTIEVIKSSAEEIAESLAFLARVKKARDEGNTAEAERIAKQADDVLKNVGVPKTELGKKLQKSAEVADTETLAGMDTGDILLEISPYLKELDDQFIANYQKKEARIAELKKKKEDLSWWASIATYLAISLQLFGLMFVLTKDLTKDLKERREKAEKEAKKAEEEAELAIAEMKEAVEDAEEAKADLVEIREDVQEAREEAQTMERKADEARDLLAELEEDVEKALDEAEENKK